MPLFLVLFSIVFLSFSVLALRSYIHLSYDNYRSAIGDLKSSNFVSAKKKLIRYAEQDHSRSEYILRIIYPDAFRIKSESRYYLGMMYAVGLGIGKDDAQAEFWFSCLQNDKSCIAGENEYRISMDLANGSLVKKNYEQSIYWLNKAVQKGYPIIADER